MEGRTGAVAPGALDWLPASDKPWKLLPESSASARGFQEAPRLPGPSVLGTSCPAWVSPNRGSEADALWLP